MYLIARNWEVQPSEFWGMTMAEWFLEYELRREHDPDNDFAGGLTQGEVDDLIAAMEMDDDEWNAEFGPKDRKK